MENQKYQVVYSLPISTILFDLVRKYHIEESDEEFLEKMKTQKPFKVALIKSIVEDIVLEKEKKEKLSTLLKEKLQIPEDTAKAMSTDVESKLLLIAKKKLFVEEPKKEEPKKQPTGIKVVDEKLEEKNPNIVRPKEDTIIKKPLPKNSEIPQIKNVPQLSKNDSYREPIE